MIKQQIAEARTLLQQRTRICNVEEHSSLGILLMHLWHEDKEIREVSALSIAGGTANEMYKPHYGHFGTQLLTTLKQEYPDKPGDVNEAYSNVGNILKLLLYRTVIDLKGLSNMHFSFLSGSLYLALLANCRDQIESTRRLGIHSAHYELCDLLLTLQSVNLTARLNVQDANVIQRLAAHALASFDPSHTPRLWNLMKSSAARDQKAVQPVLEALHHPRASTHILDAMTLITGQQKIKMLTCLGRIGSEDALPTLNCLTTTKNRAVRSAAKSAVHNIISKNKVSPHHTLLRPNTIIKDETTSLLRPNKSHNKGVDNNMLHIIVTHDEQS